LGQIVMKCSDNIAPEDIIWVRDNAFWLYMDLTSSYTGSKSKNTEFSDIAKKRTMDILRSVQRRKGNE